MPQLITPGAGSSSATHPAAAMLSVLVRHGLRPTVVHRGTVWHIAAGVR